MRRLILPAAIALIAAAPTTANAASRTITIGSAFGPSIVVVHSGTTVVWHNTDSRVHTLTGDIRSGAIAAGDTYQRALVKLGAYRYYDANNGLAKGTVIVTARRSTHPGRAVGAASRAMKGSLVVRVNESYRFYDNDWRSTSGACNGEVGNGSRSVQMRIALPNVRYFRSAKAESLSQRGARVTLVRDGEQVSAQNATSASADVTCQDGTSMDTTADQSVNCFRDYAGRKARGTFVWSPTSTSNRFEFAAPSAPRLASCGTSYSGILQVLGLPQFGLPLNLVDSRFSYNGIATSPASAREIRAIRAGHTLKVVRRINLSFTTACCDGYAPGSEAYSRVGSVHDVKASLTLTLRPK